MVLTAQLELKVTEVSLDNEVGAGGGDSLFVFNCFLQLLILLRKLEKLVVDGVSFPI